MKPLFKKIVTILKHVVVIFSVAYVEGELFYRWLQNSVVKNGLVSDYHAESSAYLFAVPATIVTVCLWTQLKPDRSPNKRCTCC